MVRLGAACGTYYMCMMITIMMMIMMMIMRMIMITFFVDNGNNGHDITNCDENYDDDDYFSWQMMT